MPPRKTFVEHLENIQKLAGMKEGVASGPPQPEVTVEVMPPVIGNLNQVDNPITLKVPLSDPKMEAELPELYIGEPLPSQYAVAIDHALVMARYAKIDIKPDRIDCWHGDRHRWIIMEDGKWVPNDRLFGTATGRALEIAAQMKQGKRIPVTQEHMALLTQAMRYGPAG